MRQPVIGVIGLGIMGGAMAEALLAQGYAVVGYDPLPAARLRRRRAGGKSLASGSAVAAHADAIITSLATSAALRNVVDELSGTKRPRCRSVIETSTLPLADKEAARKRLRHAGITTLD